MIKSLTLDFRNEIEDYNTVANAINIMLNNQLDLLIVKGWLRIKIVKLFLIISTLPQVQLNA